MSVYLHEHVCELLVGLHLLCPDDPLTDQPCTGPSSRPANWQAQPVLVGRRQQPQERSVGHAPAGVDPVVAGAIH